MNALGIYLSTSKYVMQANHCDRESWSELYRYLPYLRQALSCCVCRNLLKLPMGPTHKVCQHFVCRDCVSKPMTIKPQCSWCKKRDCFEESTELRMVVSCFKKLCEYIMNSPIGSELLQVAKDGETVSLVQIIEEGVEFEDDFKSPPVMPPAMTERAVASTSGVGVEESSVIDDGPLKTNVVSKTNKATKHKLERSKRTHKKKIRLKKYKWYTKPKRKVTLKNNNVKSSKLSTRNFDNNLLNIIPSDQIKYEIKREGIEENRPKLKVKLRAKKIENFNDNDFGVDSESIRGLSVDDTLKKDKCTGIEPSIKKLKLIFGENEFKICKCGRGGTSSQLTCLGQRCPCYVKKLPCVHCKCRGCRNPRKTYEPDTEQALRSFSTNTEHLVMC